jgi:hypothetical protein
MNVTLITAIAEILPGLLVKTPPPPILFQIVNV